MERVSRDKSKESHYEADDPAKASEFLHKHDAMVKLGIPVHRVSEHFAGSGSALRSDMEAHASGKGMSSRLRVEVISYQLCILDDTWVEATHRDVSRVSNSCTYAKLAWRSSTMRLDQNLALMDSLDDAGASKLTFLYKKFRVIGQPSVLKAIDVIPVRRGSRSDIFRKAYRFDVSALVDWSSKLEGVLKPLEAQEPLLRAKRNARLKLDYLSNAISNNQIYSILVIEGDPAAIVGRGALEAASAAIDEAASGFRFFEVLETNVRRRKLVRTAAIRAHQMMSFPALVQPYSAWKGGAQRRFSQQDVFPDGYAEVTDVLTMAEWRFFRAGLRRWKRAPSDVQGCICVLESSLVSETQWNFREGPVPAIAILEKLVALKWEVGPPATKHTLDSPRVFSFKDAVACKAYLQCLVCLPDLLGGHSFKELLVGQPNAYYSCVLQAAQPELVQLGHREAFYASTLAAGKSSKLPLLPSQGTPFADEEDMPMSSLAVNSHAKLVNPTKKRRVIEIKRGDECALWEKLPQALTRVSEGRSSASMEDEVQRESRPAESELQVECGHPDARGSADPPPSASRSRPRRARPMFVEGVPVAEEQHGEIGQPGAYQRLIVHCPCSAGRHADTRPCVKKRNVGRRQTANFGYLEPFAFLGVWLRDRNDFPSRCDHRYYKPTKASVASYMRDHGWLDS